MPERSVKVCTSELNLTDIHPILFFTAFFPFSKPLVLTPELISALPGGLVKTDSWALLSISDSAHLEGAQESAFLTSSQAVLILRVQDPHSETHLINIYEHQLETGIDPY